VRQHIREHGWGVLIENAEPQVITDRLSIYHVENPFNATVSLNKENPAKKGVTLSFVQIRGGITPVRMNDTAIELHLALEGPTTFHNRSFSWPLEPGRSLEVPPGMAYFLYAPVGSTATSLVFNSQDTGFSPQATLARPQEVVPHTYMAHAGITNMLYRKSTP